MDLRGRTYEDDREIAFHELYLSTNSFGLSNQGPRDTYGGQQKCTYSVTRETYRKETI